MNRNAIILVLLAALAACDAKDKKDYTASANCEAMGYVPGNAEYDHCVREEKAAALMEQQRREFDEMKQQQQDQTLQRIQRY